MELLCRGNHTCSTTTYFDDDLALLCPDERAVFPRSDMAVAARRSWAGPVTGRTGAAGASASPATGTLPKEYNFGPLGTWASRRREDMRETVSCRRSAGADAVLASRQSPAALAVPVRRW